MTISNVLYEGNIQVAVGDVSINSQIMKLKQAKCESDWKAASKVLKAVVRHLDETGKTLWTNHHVTIDGLKNSYELDELHFLVDADQLYGVVFLQTSDPEFWPEISDGNTLFFHKLAIHPKYIGNKIGRAAVACIIEYARERGFEWVRMDCDNRVELLNFYQSMGFSRVSTKQIYGFEVVKHQLLTNASID